MKRLRVGTLLLTIAASAAVACAHSVNTLDKVTIGMPKSDVLQNVNVTPHFVSEGATEYIIYPVMASFFAMYDDTPYSLLYVRLDNGLAVAKGIVDKREEQEIKRIDPSFDLDALRRN